MKTMQVPHIGLIGFGEVGKTFGTEMVAHGGRVLAYDVAATDPDQGEAVRARAVASGVQLAPLEAVAGEAEIVLSLVTTQVAEAAARQCAPLLGENTIYVDLNSTSPAVKLAVQRIIEGVERCFVEGAILGAVGATGAKTRTLLAGDCMQQVADELNRLGLAFEPYSEKVGSASAFKMLRSVFSKGFEAILLEMLIAGERAGIAEDLWRDVTVFMDAKPFEAIAANWITSHAVAHERRYHEMRQVGETLLEMEVDPLLTRGTEAFFQRSGSLGLQAAFKQKPDRWQDVVAHMDAALKAQIQPSSGEHDLRAGRPGADV